MGSEVLEVCQLLLAGHCVAPGLVTSTVNIARNSVAVRSPRRTMRDSSINISAENAADEITFKGFRKRWASARSDSHVGDAGTSFSEVSSLHGSEFDEQNLDDNQQDESSLKRMKEAPPKDEVEILDQAMDELIEPEPPKLPDCSALT